jgi:hypothetical protein
MHTRRRGKIGYMAIKLDMSKAYDRVEWIFLKAIMLKMGFADRWVDRIMQCVSTVSYSVLVNGSPFGQIIPTRGIRQGDPLSPYLFLLCAEGLSALVQQAECGGLVSGVPISKRGVNISHLLFADDSLVFCKATAREWGNVLQLLKKYEMASGQKLNSHKTSIFYSGNTGEDFKAFINESLGSTVNQNFDRYLGLPALMGRSKVRTFASIKGRVQKILLGWKEKFLSQAGREILIKAVVQAIPTYSMSVFMLPKALCRSLNSLMNRFWWGHNSDHRTLAWKSWSSMSVAKHNGGMGFRNLEIFNLALLAKQGWRILQHPESLVAQVMRAKYFPDTAFMQASLGRNPSYAWRSIFKAKDLIEKGMLWRVGNGETIKIWGDRWLPNFGPSRVQSPTLGMDPDTRVSFLIDQQGGWMEFCSHSGAFW